MSAERTAHTGSCTSCLANIAVWPHPEREDDVPATNEWEGPKDCPVCDGRVDWDWSDPVGDVLRAGL